MREGERVYLVPEVEWDDAERAWVGALDWYRENYLCPCGCGWPRSITLDPLTEWNYEVPPPAVCQITKQIVAAQKARSESPLAYTGPGLLWGARRRSGVAE